MTDLSNPLAADFDEARPFWDWIDLVWFLASVPLAAFVSMFLQRLIFGRSDPHATDLFRTLVFQLLIYVTVFAALFLILQLRHARSLWPALRWPVGVFRGGALFLQGALMALALAFLGVALHAPKIDNPIERLLTSPMSIAAVGILACTIGPLAEEALFRGFLQPLIKRTAGAVVAVGLTSFVFAGLHGFEYGWSWRHLLLLLLASIAFGVTRERDDSTGASTCMHAGYNLMFFAGYLFAQGRIFPTHG